MNAFYKLYSNFMHNRKSFKEYIKRVKKRHLNGTEISFVLHINWIQDNNALNETVLKASLLTY